MFLDFAMMRFFQGELIQKLEKRRISDNFLFLSNKQLQQVEKKWVFFLFLSNKRL